jgi:GntR family transcriptional regulator
MTDQSMPVRLRDQLMANFKAEALQPGDKLPSETDIARRYEVGRSTAREALKLLEQEGLITAEHGRGRFLSSLTALHVERPITRYESMTTMLAALGYDHRTTVLSAVEDEANEDERRELGLDEHAAVIRLERLRSAGDEALVYSTNTIPRELIPGPIKHINWAASLNDLLAAQGHSPVSSVARLRSVDLPENVAARYSLGELGPWLLITETAITRHGTRVLYAADYHRGERFSFSFIRR